MRSVAKSKPEKSAHKTGRGQTLSVLGSCKTNLFKFRFSALTAPLHGALCGLVAGSGIRWKTKQKSKGTSSGRTTMRPDKKRMRTRKRKRRRRG